MIIDILTFLVSVAVLVFVVMMWKKDNSSSGFTMMSPVTFSGPLQSCLSTNYETPEACCKYINTGTDDCALLAQSGTLPCGQCKQCPC